MRRQLPLIYKVKVSRRATATEAVPAKGKALLQLIRFDPSNNTKRIDSYEWDKTQDFMVLDLLTAVKAHQDPSLAFRASCCEGVCGSCGMNINGINSLACVTFAQHVTTVGPLPNFPVIKDMVVDLRGFFKQYEYIRPFVRNVNLGRYHVSSVVARYKAACKVLYGEKEVPDAITGNTAIGTSPIHLLSVLLDRCIEVGDVSKAADLLLKLEDLGYKLENDQVKAILKETAANFKKATA